VNRTLAALVLAILPALLSATPLNANAKQTDGRSAKSQASSHDRHNRHHRTNTNKNKHRQHHHQNTKK
jgi:Ni/Co efflux regulator RcnB